MRLLPALPPLGLPLAGPIENRADAVLARSAEGPTSRMRRVDRSLEAIAGALADIAARMESIAADHEPTGDLNEIAYAVSSIAQCLSDLGLWVEDLAKRATAAGY